MSKQQTVTPITTTQSPTTLNNIHHSLAKNISKTTKDLLAEFTTDTEIAKSFQDFKYAKTLSDGIKPNPHHSSNPVNLSNSYWQWIVQENLSPYDIEQITGDIDLVNDEPAFWGMQRMGQTKTQLADGRQILIGGEYEDFYDPQFYIYNDVIVKHPDGKVDIYGYPPHIFPATDFHTATLVGDYIWIIGSLGYQDKRQFTHTQVLKLNIHTYAIEVVATVNSMGWVHKHQAQYKDGQIIITGGYVLDDLSAPILEQIDIWTLNLKTLIWKNITNNNWQIFFIAREDKQCLHLQEMDSLLHEQFQQLYIPPIEHNIDFDNCNYTQTVIVIDDVRIRYVADDYCIMVYIEGKLPKKIVQILQDNLKHKLEKIENTTCTVNKCSSL